MDLWRPPNQMMMNQQQCMPSYHPPNMNYPGGPFPVGPWCPVRPNPWNNFYPHPQPHTVSRSPSRNFQKKKERKQKKEPVFIDFCDVCDRGFKNLAKKVEHFQQHTKCDEAGCNFEAHFKIVAIHKQNLHGPKALRIKLDTPEDIKRWREERKRKYPTVANIMSKAQKSSENEKLGNVLENKYFGKMNRRKVITPPQNAHNSVICDASSVQDQSVSTKDSCHSLLFSNEADSSGDSSSDEDKATNVTTSAINSIGLGSLMQNYAGDSDSENNHSSDHEEKLRVDKPNHVSTPTTTDRMHEQVMQKTTEVNQSPLVKDSIASKQLIHSKSNRTNGFRKNKRQSLLEMLLAPDIRRERNHILQCVRYIVQNQFFDAPASIDN